MSVVKINAITVPDGAGPELEARFAARFAQGCMNEVPGFLGYELLRPVAGDTRTSSTPAGSTTPPSGMAHRRRRGRALRPRQRQRQRPPAGRDRR